MSTRYAWITQPYHDQKDAIAVYDHIKEKIFAGQDCADLQLVNFGKMHVVVFLTRELSAQNPYDTFYSIDTEKLAYITDESTGGYFGYL